MKIIHYEQLVCTDRHVLTDGFASIRGILESDGMGFSLHHTTVFPTDEPQRWHYKNHLEACYCIGGRGLLESEETGERHWIEPNTCYVLDQHDPHKFMAVGDKPCLLISVFNPPCKGREVHNEDGSYD